MTEKYAVRKSPSAIDKETEKNELLRIREENEEDNDDIPEEENSEELTEQSGGKDWGSAVHRAAELIVSEGLFTKESLHASIMQAVTEQFKSELLSAQDRDNLQLPKELKSLDEIHAWLSDRIFNRLKFMMDDQSEFRQDLQGAEVYAEMPFTVSINKTDGGVHDTLASCLNVKGDKRLELSGKIDLALRYPDGSWIVADYKTDRMLPEDNGDKKQFHERLKLKYGNQLDIYRIVLEYLTGERVKETKILSV